MKPDWFERLVQRSGRDLDKYRLVDSLYQETQAIEHDLFDSRKYDSMYNQADDLVSMTRKRKLDHPTWPAVVQDAYLGLWKAQPKLRDASEMRKSHLLNMHTMDKIITTKEYEELRTWTRLDDWASAMGTTSLADRLGKFFDEQKDLQEKQDKLQSQEQDMLDAMGAMQQAAEQGLSDEEIDEMLDEMESMLKEYESTAEDFENDIQANQFDLKQAAQNGMAAAREAAEETMELVQGFGTDPGQWQRLDARARLQLAQRVGRSRKLQEVAKLIGRMKRMSVGQWQRRVIHGVDEIYDVTIGANLENVLPGELSYLADKDTENIFFAKYLDHALMQYDLRGAEKAARGPIVVCLDNSGSMSGNREVWGKAVALSLLEIAKREKRDFYGIHFGSRHEIKEWHFPGGEVELNDVLDYAEFFFNGGTDFEEPISRAVKAIQKHFTEEGAAKGDIIFITDGESSVSQAWLTQYTNAKRDMAFRMFGVLIGYSARVLAVLSDEVYTIKDLMSGNEVKEMFTLL